MKRIERVLDINFGKTVKDNDQYLLQDSHFLKNLTLSRTILRPGQATNGHKHPNPDVDEVYIFMDGKGMIEIDDEKHEVIAGDIVLIKGHEFHKVINSSPYFSLRFLSVFNPYERNK
jgi:quercetin dioxygenase-like cupin family protein